MRLFTLAAPASYTKSEKEHVSVHTSEMAAAVLRAAKKHFDSHGKE